MPLAPDPLHASRPYASLWTLLALRTPPVPPAPHATLPRPRVNETSLGDNVDEHMLQLNVAKVDLVLHMLQWLYTCVTIICFKCFSCFKRMLQVFHLDVAYIAVVMQICCNCVFQCFSYFIWMLHVFI
jgi:hypothetical protein